MEKRTIIKNIAYAAVLVSCLIISSCGGSNTYTDSYAVPSTTKTTTTATTTTTAKPSETKERTYTLSDSEAKSIAKSFITRAYTDEDSAFKPVTDRVYFGDVNVLTSMAEKNFVYVSVSGHYYKKDKYGNSGSQTVFTKTIKINCETKKAYFY